MRWWRTWRTLRMSPIAPEGARVVHLDGTATPIPLVYAGVREGLHEWHVHPPVQYQMGDHLEIGMLPARTSIMWRSGQIE